MLMALIFGISSFLSRNNNINLWRQQVAYEDWKFFYRRYPWRFVSEISLVAFGMVLVLTGHGFGLTVAQAFSIGLALWFIPLLVGELFFGGRRIPEEER